MDKTQRSVAGGVKRLLIIILCLLAVQLIYGALMAGHKAATIAPTWPTINGAWYPMGIWADSPLLLNLIDNKITIHFIHRNLAYLIVILIIVWYVKASRQNLPAMTRKWLRLPLLLVVMQVMLGVFSLLFSVEIIPNHWGNFEWMAQLHQLVAMFLLLSLVTMLYLFNGRRAVL